MSPKRIIQRDSERGHQCLLDRHHSIRTEIESSHARRESTIVKKQSPRFVLESRRFIRIVVHTGIHYHIRLSVSSERSSLFSDPKKILEIVQGSSVFGGQFCLKRFSKGKLLLSRVHCDRPDRKRVALETKQQVD